MWTHRAMEEKLQIFAFLLNAVLLMFHTFSTEHSTPTAFSLFFLFCITVFGCFVSFCLFYFIAYSAWSSWLSSFSLDEYPVFHYHCYSSIQLLFLLLLSPTCFPCIFPSFFLFFLCTPSPGHILPVLETNYSIFFLHSFEHITEKCFVRALQDGQFNCVINYISKSAHNVSCLLVPRASPSGTGCCAEGLSEQIQAPLVSKWNVSNGKSMDVTSVKQSYNSLWQTRSWYSL